MDSMVKPIIIGLISQVLSAWLITALLITAAKSKSLTYCAQVRFVMLIALTAGILCHLPNWNWWGFSTGYTLVAIVDMLIGGLLLGMVLAKIVK